LKALSLQISLAKKKINIFTLCNTSPAALKKKKKRKEFPFQHI
jgi:hypothetical protein